MLYSKSRVYLVIVMNLLNLNSMKNHYIQKTILSNDGKSEYYYISINYYSSIYISVYSNMV